VVIVEGFSACLRVVAAGFPSPKNVSAWVPMGAESSIGMVKKFTPKKVGYTTIYLSFPTLAGERPFRRQFAN
jgi:hypothetical protein